MIKRIATLILTLGIFASALPVQAVSFNMQGDEEESSEDNISQVQLYSTATVVDSGYCGGEGDGTNLTWTLYNDGLLEITGTGDMKNYYYYSSSITTAPWGTYKDSLTSLSIGEGITSIGK